MYQIRETSHGREVKNFVSVHHDIPMECLSDAEEVSEPCSLQPSVINSSTSDKIAMYLVSKLRGSIFLKTLDLEEGEAFYDICETR